MEKLLPDLEALEREAADFATALAPKEQGATLVTLSGELGAGKTAFAKALAKALGIEEPVTSPTFVLEKIYALPKSAKFARLAHIDAYRLEDESELAALGFDELMSDPQTLVVLEWPEKVAAMTQDPAHRITLSVALPEGRIIAYAGND